MLCTATTEKIEVRLGEICHLSSGFTARGRLEPAPSGGLPAIQLRDVQGDDEVGSGSLHRYQVGNLPDRYLVRGGEVIFKSRGEPNTATVVSALLGEPAVVILPLIIIRPNRDAVLPGYLAWAINQPDAQRRLDAEAQGTSLRMIPKAVLERIDIPLPDLFYPAPHRGHPRARKARELAAPRACRTPRTTHQPGSDGAGQARPPKGTSAVTDQITQQQINQTAWAACDTFRGAVDAGQYKDYILVMLFLKYISDLWNDHLETYRKQFGDDDAAHPPAPGARAFLPTRGC